MNTYVKIFKFEYLKKAEDHLNEYFRKHNLTPLSISMTEDCGRIIVAVVVTKESEDTK